MSLPSAALWGRKARWESTYYYIEDNRHTDHEDCKIVIKPAFCNEACFGRRDMSKTRTPRHFAESHDNPVRCHLLLRAWAWQRCFPSPFRQGEGFRRRDLLSEGARLEGLNAEVEAAPVVHKEHIPLGTKPKRAEAKLRHVAAPDGPTWGGFG